MDLIELEGMRVATSRADLALAPGEAVLGGGTWLFSEPQPGIRGLVDLTALGWEPVTALPGGGLSIAATCTLAQLRDAASRFGTAAAVVAVCVDALLGSWKIHRVATVGGNICLALPAGPMTSLASGLGATAVVWTPEGGERRVAVSDFVTGVRATRLAPGEVLRAVEFPAPPAWVAHRRASLAPLGRSAVLVLARRSAGHEPAAGFAIAVTASTPAPRVFTFPTVPAAGDLAAAIEDCEWYDDAHGAPDWRRAMTLRFAEELRVESLGAEASA